jgi:mannitol/fructose-specific phosphotransferase system IIA component|tara:strand:+ start:688 stop:930 length:243 start_codon:yes stop_codon:yes gene_type:complete
MVNALVTLDENTNRVLNVVKATHDLKDKGEAIQFVVKKFAEQEDEPELRPEFIEKMKKIEKEKSIKVGTLENFRKRYGMK